MESHSTQTARHSEESCPTIEATRRAIIDHIVLDAIDNYETARRRDAMYAAATDSFDVGGLEVFGVLADRRVREAREYLVRVLLARSGHAVDGDDYDAEEEGRIRPTCGVVAGGKVYLAAVRHDLDMDEVGTKASRRRGPVMDLTVADRADVAEMGPVALDELAPAVPGSPPADAG